MKKIFLVLFVVGLSVFTAISLGAEECFKVICASFVKIPPEIDGKLDESCWKEAETVNNFLEYNNQDSSAKLQTRFSILYDSQNIYFAMRCDGPTLTAKSTLHDQWPKGNVIEIFLDPGLSRSDYYQFAANPSGCRYEGFKRDKKWDCDWVAASHQEKNGWTMEICIPLIPMKTTKPTSGKKWGINICRNSNRMSTWSRVGVYFHSPGNFGTLIFGNYAQWWKMGFCSSWKESEEQINQSLQNKIRQDREISRQLKIAIKMAKNLEKEVKSKGEIKTRKDFIAVFPKAENILKIFQNIKEEIKWIEAIKLIKEKEKK